MDDFIGILFLLCIIINLGVFFVKAYNVMSKQSLFDIRINSLLWVLSVISWVFAFFVVLTVYDLLLYSVIFRFITLIALINLLFYFVEMIYYLRSLTDMFSRY